MLFFHWQTRQEMVTASVRQAYCNSQPTTSQNGAERPEFSSIVPAVYSFNPPYCPLQLVVVDSANIFLCCGNFNDYFLLCSLQLVVVCAASPILLWLDVRLWCFNWSFPFFLTIEFHFTTFQGKFKVSKVFTALDAVCCFGAYIPNQSKSSVFLDTHVYKEEGKGNRRVLFMFSLWISIWLG